MKMQCKYRVLPFVEDDETCVKTNIAEQKEKALANINKTVEKKCTKAQY